MSLPSLRDRISLLPQQAYEQVLRAGADGGEGAIDFSVLSVAVTTLGLILCVELIRHKLDLTAIGRPFMRTVLEGVYRELATLGIVEFIIFLLHKYYTNLNIAQELVFADVHFTLFFTALFNAMQSCIMAFFVSRNSDRLWVQTEYQDLHHYVEIREEFDRVETELQSLKYVSENVTDNENSSPSVRRSISSLCWGTLRTLQLVVSFLFRSLRYPGLTRKHHDLLVQVRFHELKFHFIQANKLPITLHVSEYMKRCELHILQKLVHISTFTWLLLTGFLNLLYFIMGVVANETDGDMYVVGRALSGIFFSAVVLFVLVSLVIWSKMTWIFNQIMHTKLISQAGTEGDEGPMPTESTRKFVELQDGDDFVEIQKLKSIDDEEVFDQKSLFWGSSPKYITIMIQFMQFGFALVLSTLLVFWKTINNENGIDGGYFLLAVLLCYFAFVQICSHVVPRYTLCTSVGQLVDQRRLHETLARHRLEEAQREREQAIMERELEESFMNSDADAFQLQPKLLEPLKSIVKTVLPVEAKKKKAIPSVKELTVANELMEKMVLTDTKALRKTLPQEEQEKLSERERLINERKNRRKTLSDGVEAMCHMVHRGSEDQDDAMSKDSIGATSADRRAARRNNRRKSVSASASIQMMRDVGVPKAPTVESPPRAKDDDSIMTEQRAQRRANRTKTMSASADIRMMRMATLEEGKSASFKQPVPIAADPKLDIFDPTSAIVANKPTAFGRPFPTAKFPVQSNYVPTLPTIQAQDFSSSFGDLPQSPLKEESENEPSIREIFAPTKETSDHLSTTERLHGYANNPETMTATDSDDEGSDVDDLPEVQESDKLRKEVGFVPKVKLSDHARCYFRGRKYVMISAVFGTGVCFYFIGNRLESVMNETGIVDDYKNTWNFHSSVAFWLELTWLSFFVLGDFIILVLFRPAKMLDEVDRSCFLAAIIDLMVTSACIALLVIAQIQRCCDDGYKRALAGNDGGYGDYVETYVECCPAFGQRLYGGFGDIEMFTSLIALRGFRFVVAKFIVKILDKKFGRTDKVPLTGKEEEMQSVRATHPFDPLFDRAKKGHTHGDGTLENDTGTVVELWKTALGLYPDIVAKHGAFSGELLQAMLGISVIENVLNPTFPPQAAINSVPDDLHEVSPVKLSSLSQTNPTRQQSSHIEPRPNSMAKSVSYRGPDTVFPTQGISYAQAIRPDRRYSGLSPGAQSVILSGKLGKSVRARRESQESWDGSKSLGRLLEGIPSASDGQASTAFDESMSGLGKSHAHMSLQFDIGNELDDDESAKQFFAPNARLLRSMRRCDRKVLPLLGKWTVVDVVITKYEIVYFDASDVDEEVVDNSTLMKHKQEIREALRATKGGKGLRLRDVAFGRRVVGHQEIKNIEEIHVERVQPHVSSVQEQAVMQPLGDEYWKTGNRYVPELSGEDDRPTRDYRWTLIKEDRLMLKTKHDTLYLRFYSDLDNAESHTERMRNEKETEGDIYKNNAFQWCQSIGRLVGSGKLKQELPHFGEDNCDELRDYLVVVELNKDPNGARFPNFLSHRRQKSESLIGLELPDGNANRVRVNTAPDDTPNGTPLGKPIGRLRFGRRSSSFEEGLIDESTIAALKRPKMRMRRTQSTGDYDLNAINALSSERNSEAIKEDGNLEGNIDSMI